MTENEAQKWLEKFEWDDSEETNEALVTICEALQEYPKFRAIGTIEEFKAIKQWKSDVMEDFCRYDASSFEEIVANARAKAIDEFAETLNKKISEFVLEHKDNLDFASGISVAWNMVDEIAEQMKAGEKNE